MQSEERQTEQVKKSFEEWVAKQFPDTNKTFFNWSDEECYLNLDASKMFISFYAGCLLGMGHSI
jgi:hypothetical protein